MTEPSKSLVKLTGDKIGDKLREKVAEWIVGTVFVGCLLFARHWIADEWVCIKKPWCEVRGWSLGVLIAATVATGAAAIYLGLRLYRTRRELQTIRSEHRATVKAESASSPLFHPIRVEDQRLLLLWIIRRPPSEWLNMRRIATNVSPLVVQNILDGPFHAVSGCNAALEEIPGVGDSGSSPTISDRCPSCGERIFRARGTRSGFDNPVSVWTVRAQALEEVQRMERNGTKFDGWPIILERPTYWNAMLPLK